MVVFNNRSESYTPYSIIAVSLSESAGKTSHLKTSSPASFPRRHTPYMFNVFVREIYLLYECFMILSMSLYLACVAPTSLCDTAMCIMMQMNKLHYLLWSFVDTRRATRCGGGNALQKAVLHVVQHPVFQWKPEAIAAVL
ncbi:hypothetical protein J6590_039524 [Homalodisca vitripennis]|nr:hypothetical protein J6590_039524 [Homalodisca vitripennis]